MVSAGEFWFVVFLVIIALWRWWIVLKVLAGPLGIVDVLPTSGRSWIVLEILACALGIVYTFPSALGRTVFDVCRS